MTAEKATKGCSTGCAHCAVDTAAANPEGPQGASLALRSMLVFLLPLAMAIAGAFLVRGSEGRETLGALVGLLAGFAVSVAWTRYRNKKR